jgi:hypothetical protein
LEVKDDGLNWKDRFGILTFDEGHHSQL